MSPRQRGNTPDRPATEEETRDGYRLNGQVMLVGVFGTMVPLLIALALGVKPLVAVICGIVIGGVLAINVRRVLERKFREKHPDWR